MGSTSLSLLWSMRRPDRPRSLLIHLFDPSVSTPTRELLTAKESDKHHMITPSPASTAQCTTPPLEEALNAALVQLATARALLAGWQMQRRQAGT